LRAFYTRKVKSRNYQLARPLKKLKSTNAKMLENWDGIQRRKSESLKPNIKYTIRITQKTWYVKRTINPLFQTFGSLGVEKVNLRATE